MMFRSEDEGGYGAGSFWGRGNALFGGNPMDDILDKQNFTLEMILDEDTTIQETKGLNERLIEYLKQPHIISLLLDYIGCVDLDSYLALCSQSKALQKEWHKQQRIGHGESMGSITEGNGEEEDDDEEEEDESGGFAHAAALVVDEEDAQDDLQALNEERVVKFPFVACELICCNVTAIIEPLVNDAKLLSKFFGLLDKPTLDSRVSGYFFKILSVLTRRAPEKMLWFTIYKNVDISDKGCEGGIDGIGWLIPLFLKHIDFYSIMCCFKTLLRIAADENGLVEEGEEEDEDEHNSLGGYGHGAPRHQEEQVGDLDGHSPEAGVDEHRNALLRKVRSIWLGGSGTALAVLEALAASSNSDSHGNAAEILVDMIQRSAMARLSLQGDDQPPAATMDNKNGSSTSINGNGDIDDLLQINNDKGDDKKDLLPKFDGLILVDPGSGPNAASAMIESGCEWMLQLCEQLVRTALFQPKDGSPPPSSSSSETGEEEVDDSNARIVTLGSAAVASLQVLTHLVSAFALERWSDPGEAMIQQGLGHLTTVEKHGVTPPEIDIILSRLPDFVRCLKTEEHAKLFRISQEWANRYLGMHRLKVVELICMLLHAKYPDILENVAEMEVDNPLAVCIDLFFQFQWNNCLHSVLERTLDFVFLGGVTEESLGFGDEDDDDAFRHHRHGSIVEDDEDEEEQEFRKRTLLRQEEFSKEQAAASRMLLPLQQALFGRCNIIGRLLEAYEKNPRTESGQYICGEQGHMGFCHRIANTILLVAATQRNERERILEQQASDLLDNERWPALTATETNEEWIKFVQEELSQINATEQCVLGGVRPQIFSSQGSEGLDDFDQGDDLDNDLDFPPNFNSFGISGGDGNRKDLYFDDDDSDEDDDDDNDEEDDDDDDDAFAAFASETTSTSDISFGSREDHAVAESTPPDWTPFDDDDGNKEGAADDWTPFDDTPSVIPPVPPPLPPLEDTTTTTTKKDEEWSPFGNDDTESSTATTKAKEEEEEEEWSPF